MSETVGVRTLSLSGAATRALTFIELTKPRIAVLVLVATALGFFLGMATGTTLFTAGPLLFHVLFGTTLVAAGANALNQYIEVEHDRKMNRTKNRPLPSGRLGRGEALAFGVILGVTGVCYLAVLTNIVAAGCAAVTLLLYVFVYTPSKRIGPFCVLVGAVPGALPPVIGWAAASGSISFEAWLLFAIVFIWQLPHFAAIAWLYRDDYRRAGFPMMPVVDEQGIRTDLHLITHSVTLLAASLLPVVYGVVGTAYAASAMVLGTGFLAMGILFVLRKTVPMARLHLAASVTYLPCLCLAMMLDKVGV